jgi:hypothetical protein
VTIRKCLEPCLGLRATKLLIEVLDHKLQTTKFRRLHAQVIDDRLCHFSNPFVHFPKAVVQLIHLVKTLKGIVEILLELFVFGLLDSEHVLQTEYSVLWEFPELVLKVLARLGYSFLHLLLVVQELNAIFLGGVNRRSKHPSLLVGRMLDKSLCCVGPAACVAGRLRTASANTESSVAITIGAILNGVHAGFVRVLGLDEINVLLTDALIHFLVDIGIHQGYLTC